MSTRGTIRQVAWHPSDQDIELYSLGRLNDEAILAPLEEHLLVCLLCQDRVAEADTYLAALREALKSVDRVEGRPGAAEIFAIHQTADGTVYLWIDRRASGKWIGRVTGAALDSGQEADTPQEAASDAVSFFYQMFPEHVCVPACLGRPAERRSA